MTFNQDTADDAVTTRKSTPEDHKVGGSESADAVALASWVTVKRTKSLFGAGAYGTRGILALTDSKLIFLASGRTAWEIDRSMITKVRRPRWALGTYLTFETSAGFYGVSFGGRGMPSLVSGSDLAIRFGGAVGVGVGVLGDAVAVAGMRRTANVTKRWFGLLSRGA